jgi:hypothetical protein
MAAAGGRCGGGRWPAAMVLTERGRRTAWWSVRAGQMSRSRQAARWSNDVAVGAGSAVVAAAVGKARDFQKHAKELSWGKPLQLPELPIHSP